MNDSLAQVAYGAQGPLQGVEVVHLLQTDDVRLVSDELLQDPPPPHSPAQGLGRALHKLVPLGAQGLWQVVPLQHSNTAATSWS